MKKPRNHWTTTDPTFVRKAIGATEKKLRNGKWIKVTKDAVVRGESRDEVRTKAKEAVAA